MTYKRYKSRFKEEIIGGKLHPYYDQPSTMVRKIESYNEFKKITNKSRGVFVNDSLYLATNSNAPIIHNDLLMFLTKFEKFSHNEYIRVIKENNRLWLGDGQKNQLSSLDRDFLNSFENKMNELKIYFRYDELK